MSNDQKSGPEVPTAEVYKDIVETVPVVGPTLGRAVLSIAAGLSKLETRLMANTRRDLEAGGDER